MAAYARATYHATKPAPPEPAIIGLWRQMVAEEEARQAAELAASKGHVGGLRFRTPVSSIGICRLRAGNSGAHEELRSLRVGPQCVRGASG